MKLFCVLFFGLGVFGLINANSFDIGRYMPRSQPFFFRLLRKYELWPRINASDSKTDNSNSPYIVGGYPADIKYFPFQLSLRIGEYHVCGASIIGTNWALTAAHCFDDNTIANYVSFRAGSPHRLIGGSVHNAEEILLHPGYNKEHLNNDVAVVRVKQPFIGENVQVVPLITANQFISDNTIGIVSGWGSDGEAMPLTLNAVNMQTMLEDECERTWIEQITEQMFCAGAITGIDTCNGDSGGPMVSTEGVQFGIVSWGRVTCGTNYPAVFVNITNPSIRLFIQQQTGI